MKRTLPTPHIIAGTRPLKRTKHPVKPIFRIDDGIVHPNDGITSPRERIYKPWIQQIKKPESGIHRYDRGKDDVA